MIYIWKCEYTTHYRIVHQCNSRIKNKVIIGYKENLVHCLLFNSPKQKDDLKKSSLVGKKA